MNTLRVHRRLRRRRGTVLIITLWIVFILAGLVLVFARSMYVEATASANHIDAIKAAAIERGAEQYIIALIDQNQSNQQVMTLESSYFAGITLGSGERPDGYFWVIRPNYGDDTLPSFGLVDEASKININYATEDMLLYLPYMSEDLVEAIIDWRDADDMPLSYGVESDYYATLPNAYMAKNGPLETVEELLLVKGWTRPLLYGVVPEMNSGRIKPAGTSGFPMNEPTDRFAATDIPGLDGWMSGIGSDWPYQYGLYDYLTVYSHEPAATATTGGSRPGGGNNAAKPTDGLININLAPREVLYCLGLDDSDISTILSYRSSSNFDPADITWINQALPQKAAALASKITGSSYQYSANILAVSANGRGFRHVRIVVDARVSPPQIIYRKDLTDRGWPMAPEVLAGLRSGSLDPSQVTLIGGAR